MGLAEIRRKTARSNSAAFWVDHRAWASYTQTRHEKARRKIPELPANIGKQRIWPFQLVVVSEHSQMPTPSDYLVDQIRGLLNRLAACRRLDNDDQEAIGDEVAAQARGLPRDGVMEALDKAIGTSKQRRREAVYILSELSDVAEAVERIGEWLKGPDKEMKSWLIQIVEHRRLKQFAPLLNNIIESDSDLSCRTSAIHASGALKERENLPVLLRLAEQGDGELIGSLAWTLKDYATEECRPYLQRWFEDRTQPDSTRFVSAWGMGKLGDEKAIRYLAEVLEEPDLQGRTFFVPGQSIRAAQALCDIYGWPFEWHKSSVAKTTKLFKEYDQRR